MDDNAGSGMTLVHIYASVAEAWDGLWSLPLASIAAVASAVFAGLQIMSSRRESARRSVSGLSCHYYTQNQMLPEGCDAGEPGAWSDEEVVFRLDNVSDFPFIGLTAVIDLANHQLRAAVDWVPPRSTLYCKAGLADEHHFMHLDGVAGVSVTFVDSSGLIWHRTAEGRLLRGRHPLRRWIWRLWTVAPYGIRDSLPTRVRPRAVNGRPHFGATISGVGDRSHTDFRVEQSWAFFEPNRETVEKDQYSAPPGCFNPIDCSTQKVPLEDD